MYVSVFYISPETRDTHAQGDVLILFHSLSFPLSVCGGKRGGGTEEPCALPTAAVVGHLLPTHTDSHCVPPPSLPSPPSRPLLLGGDKLAACFFSLPPSPPPPPELCEVEGWVMHSTVFFQAAPPLSPVTDLVARPSNSCSMQWMWEGPGQESSLGRAVWGRW